MATADTSRSRAGIIFHDVEPWELNPGDHIYCYRVMFSYSHHGIYVGKPGREVIHFAGKGSGGGGKSKSAATIRACTLREFTNGDQLRLVAYDVTTLEKVIKRAESSHVYESRPAKDVIATAEYYLDNPRGFGEYDVVFNNCESFAFYCKTKKTFNVAGQGPLRFVPGVQHVTDVFEGVLNRLEKIFN